MHTSATSGHHRQNLEMSAVCAGYHGYDVIRGIDMTINEGEIVALLGPNGSGKSTLVNAISGLVKVSRGSVRFAGRDLTPLAPHRVVREGVVQVPNARRLFPYSTVAQNMRIGGYGNNDKSCLDDDFERLLKSWPRLKPLLRREALSLSGGEQQLVALARGLMARPRLLMLDEPSLGLAPNVLDDFFASLERLNESTRLPMLVVEQNVRKALQIAHRIYVIVDGVLVHEGGTRDIQPHDVVDIYFENSKDARHRSEEGE